MRAGVSQDRCLAKSVYIRQSGPDSGIGMHLCRANSVHVGQSRPDHGLGMHRCRSNSVHIRQPGPDSGLGMQVKALKPFRVVPSSLGRGTGFTVTTGDEPM
jgi:hypothetical protein